jgi:hypothetical protein
MKHTIKAPATVRELGDLAEKLDMDLMEVWDLLTDALGAKWWEHGLGEVTFTFNTVIEAPKAPLPPAGYVLAEGVDDRWIAAEIETAGSVIIPVWNAIDQHLLELWTDKNTDDESMVELSTADAFDLAADLITAARAAETASNSAGN